MAVTAPPEAWDHLARLLLERRIRIDRRYRNRRLFADERQVNYKLVADIEKRRRTDFGDDTIIALEFAYAWEPGSIERVLKGGDPEPLRPVPPATAGELIRRAREALPMDIPAAARLMAEHCAPGETVTSDEWRAIERGAAVGDSVLAAMSATVAVEPDQLEKAGRAKAADILREIRSRALGASQDGQDPDLAEMVAEWPSMSAEQRMAVKGVFNLVTGRTVPPVAHQLDTRRYGTTG